MLPGLEAAKRALSLSFWQIESNFLRDAFEHANQPYDENSSAFASAGEHYLRRLIEHPNHLLAQPATASSLPHRLRQWRMSPGIALDGYHLIEACKASLKRLQVDHVDLYQIHGFNLAMPIEETLRALDTLVQHGHVRYVGVSNWAAWQITTAPGLAERLGLHRFVSLQAYYTLVGRDLEREIAPMLVSEEVGLMVWSQFAGVFCRASTAPVSLPAVAGRRSIFRPWIRDAAMP